MNDFFKTQNGKVFLANISSIAKSMGEIAKSVDQSVSRQEKVNERILERLDNLTEALSESRQAVDEITVGPSVEPARVIPAPPPPVPMRKTPAKKSNADLNPDLGTYDPDAEEEVLDEDLEADLARGSCFKCGSSLDDNYFCTGDQDENDSCDQLGVYQGPKMSKESPHGTCPKCKVKLNVRGFCLTNPLNCTFAKEHQMSPGVLDFVCTKCRVRNEGRPVMVANQPICKTCKTA